jgi:adenylate cyclase
MHPLKDGDHPTPHTILIVDDEPDILDSLKELLEGAVPNVEVQTATDGVAGLEVLASHPVKIIISDFKMAGMNGLEFLRQARDQAPNVARILITAFPDLQIAIEAINKAAIENFFTKPLDPDEVVRVVANMLEKKVREMQRDRAFARAMDLKRNDKGDA